MPDIREFWGTSHIQRYIQPIIFVLDASASMSGKNAELMNHAGRKAIEVFKYCEARYPRELKIGIIKSNGEWVTGKKLCPIDDFLWENVNVGDGGSRGLYKTLDELNSRMSSRRLFNYGDMVFPIPIIIYIGNNFGIQSLNMENELKSSSTFKNIKKSKWYGYAEVWAICVGDNANLNLFRDLTGSSEAIFSLNELDILERIIDISTMRAEIMWELDDDEDEV